MLCERIERAFGHEPAPAADDVLAPRFRTSIDAEEMLLAIRDKHWTELPVETTFYHREMIGALSAAGYRAYIAAFMRTSLEPGRFAPDLIGYTVSSLHPISDAPEDIDQARERLSLLTGEQRAAIADYLRYLADEHHLGEARQVLQAWPG